MFKKLAAHLQRGKRGEKTAATYLQAQGVTIVAKNVRSRYGEIDLIAKENDTLLFVEVRVRQAGALVSALESITLSKQRKWQRSAQDYLQKHHQSPPDCRFDAICITEHPTQAASIEWFKGVIHS